MSQFVTLANSLKELGATIIIVTASIWFAYRYLPRAMKQQGEVEEILRNSTATIEACTEALRMVTAHNGDIKEALVRCETKLEEILKRQNEITLELRSKRRS